MDSLLVKVPFVIGVETIFNAQSLQDIYYIKYQINEVFIWLKNE
jgi:hypothetical protein